MKALQVPDARFRLVLVPRRAREARPTTRRADRAACGARESEGAGGEPVLAARRPETPAPSARGQADRHRRNRVAAAGPHERRSTARCSPPSAQRWRLASPGRAECPSRPTARVQPSSRRARLRIAEAPDASML